MFFFEEIGNNTIERCHQCSLFHIIFGRLILGFTLLITTFYFCQFQYIGRHSFQIIGCIPLSYQYILHLQCGLGQSIFLLCQRIIQLKQIKFCYFLPFTHHISIFHPNMGHYFCSAKIQVGIILCHNLPITDQFMIEYSFFQRHHRHLIGQ